MEILYFLGVIVLLMMVVNLRSRVEKLERNSKRAVAQQTIDTNSANTSQQLSDIPESLLGYIRQQVKEGVFIEDIKRSLLDNGWQMSVIDKAFGLISLAPKSNEALYISGELGPTASDKFIDWIKEDWLLKLGALLLLIGFGWLVTYAFLNNWIGPIGRIGMGLAAGLAFLLFGVYRIKEYLHQGGIFLVLGSTTILITIYAARDIYGFFTPLTALAVMFLSTAFVALVSVKYNNRPLALASLVLAGVAPLLTNAPGPDYIGLFAYLLVVIVGAVWITTLTGRRELTTAALAIVVFYSLPHLVGYASKDSGDLLLFAFAFAAIFFITNMLGILKQQGKDILPDLVTAAANGLLLLSWIMVAAQDEWKSLIISAWMIVFAVGAFSIFRITQRREPFYIYAGIGIAMLAAATSAELQGATLTIAYTIESGIIALIAYSLLKDIGVAERISLLLLGPVILSLEKVFNYSRTARGLNQDFFVLIVLSLTFLGLASYFLHLVKKTDDDASKSLNITLFVVGSFYAFALLWNYLDAYLQADNVAVIISLVVYTIVGLISYFYGIMKESKPLRYYGGVLIGLVVGRLLLIDIQQMELTAKIITFFIIGVLLISTAFLGKTRKNKA